LSTSRAFQSDSRYANPCFPSCCLSIDTSACKPHNLSESIYFSKGLVFRIVAILSLASIIIPSHPFELRAKKYNLLQIITYSNTNDEYTGTRARVAWGQNLRGSEQMRASKKDKCP
jgi:hypothetical protein